MFWSKDKKQNNHNGSTLEDSIILADYLVDGLLLFDIDNHLSIINSSAENFLDVKREDVLGKSVLELSRFERISPLVSLLGGGLEEHFREELKLDKDLILEITSIQIRYQGEKVSTLIILHDVTREKLAEQAKTEFITLAAHQLRTPISGIKWSLQALFDGDLGELNKKQKEIVDQARKTNNKVINLINALLNVAEIEEGKHIKNLTLKNIEELIKSVVQDYEEEIKRKKIEINLTKDSDDIPKVMVDSEKIKIAIDNIINNAVRYTFGGGSIDIVLSKKEKSIEVKIKDTGVGIPLSQQGKLFSKFFRASNIMKIDTEGTGLGLYMSKNIIEAHDGRIWFESEENKGTTFWFSIPIKEGYSQFLTEEFY